MSDTPQGPDWWQASDDKWYPPPRPEMPGGADATAVSSPATAAPAGVGAGPMPPPGAPAGPPGVPPTGPPSGGFPPAGAPSGGFPPGAPPSPYGGVPGAQPPGAQNRTPLYIAIGVVVAAALIGLIVVLSGGDEEEPAPSTPSTEEAPTTEVDPSNTGGTSDTTTSDEPSGAADLEVVESGFSNYMGGYDRDEQTAAYGFVVENTGDDVAVDVSVSVSAFDADGTAVASESHTIYVLRPGEKMGIGDEFWGDDLTAEIADLQVQLSEPSGYGAEDVPEEGTLTAEGITTTTDDYGVTTKFTATSTYDQQLDYPSAYAIYRNAGGDIIGGSRGSVDFVAPNGSTAGEVTSWEVIPDIATTEVYLDAGYFY